MMIHLLTRRSAIVVLLMSFLLFSMTNSGAGAESQTTERSVQLNTAAATESNDPTGLKLVDWLLIALYAASTIGLGIYFSRKQESTDEYFTGGGNMNPILIGVSLFATLLSTISYLSMPGEAAGKGPVSMIGMLALPLVYLVIAYFVLPIYMRQRVTSAYELLEERLGLSTRLLGASMFLALRLVWMTLLVYLAAKAMTVMIGTDYWLINFDTMSSASFRFSNPPIPGESFSGIWAWNGSELRLASVPVIVLFTGIVAITYTTLGGLRAVVVTDLMQTVILFGGAVLVLATITWDFGGFGWFPTSWQSNWDSQPFFPDNPRTRATVVGTILTTFTWYIATSAGDQTSVQRFMATRDVKAARRALATQLTIGVIVGLTLYLVGFALLSYFQANPSELPASIDIKNNADQLFPRFIAYHLPVGVAGLVVAAMFAAAMSSIDSGVNSITAVVMTDFLDRFGLKPQTEKGQVRAARCLALGIGAVVVFGSTYMKYIEGNITAVTNKTVNLLTTPIFALFFFAIFVRRASAVSVWIGAFFGTITAAAIAFSGPLASLLFTQEYTDFGIDPATFGVELIEKTIRATGETWKLVKGDDPISFQYIGPVALTVNIVVGYIACWLFPRRDKS
jgi:SSS family solute:Na+ symporter